MTELLFCPFCRSARITLEIGSQSAWVECPDCLATGPPEPAGEAAQAAWNRRYAAAQPELPGVVLPYRRGAEAEYMAEILKRVEAPPCP